MNDGPQNHEFRQQLAGLTLVEQLGVLLLIRFRLASTRRRRWTVIDASPIVHVIG